MMSEDMMTDEPGYDESWPIIAQAVGLRAAFQAVKYWHEVEQNHRLQSARVNLKARIAEILREAKVTGLTFGEDGTFIQWLNDQEGVWTLATFRVKQDDGHDTISYHLRESDPMAITEEIDGQDLKQFWEKYGTVREQRLPDGTTEEVVLLDLDLDRAYPQAPEHTEAEDDGENTATEPNSL